MAHFLGLSMAMWNALFASIMGVMMVVFLVKLKRRAV
jgi:membrane associated rhomboid family serine protease